MSEMDYNLRRLLLTVAISIWVILAMYIGAATYNTIRDLQRRVGQLEQER